MLNSTLNTGSKTSVSVSAFLMKELWRAELQLGARIATVLA